jgi:hypothetical protein
MCGDDLERADLGELGDDVVGDPVTEVLVLGIDTHVLERKHGDGLGYRCRCGQTIHLVRVVQRQDMRVMEAGCGLDLLEEPRRAHRCGDVGTQDLHGDRAFIFQVVGEEDGRHPA